jgi:hypothetical protein
MVGTGGGVMAFTHIQTIETFSGSGVTTLTATLGAAPTIGNIVCATLACSASSLITGVTVVDNNSNAYTLTPSSPSSFTLSGPIFLQTCLAYLLVAPSNATAAIKATWTNGAVMAMFVDEFSCSPGTQAFDHDATGNDGGTPGTSINTPTIVPINANSLLYAVTMGQQTINSPSAGSPLNGWTFANNISDAEVEYILSATGTTTVSFVQSSSGPWSTMAMAFSPIALTPGAPIIISSMGRVRII